ncbi:hypothetical protein Csa_009353, partial [Cucumis sativus]
KLNYYRKGNGMEQGVSLPFPTVYNLEFHRYIIIVRFSIRTGQLIVGKVTTISVVWTTH